MYPRNSANPPSIAATVVKASDNSAITSGVAVKYRAAGSTAQGEGGGTLVHNGSGEWRYIPTQAETDVISFSIKFYHADAVGLGPTVNTITDTFDLPSLYARGVW